MKTSLLRTSPFPSWLKDVVSSTLVVPTQCKAGLSSTNITIVIMSYPLPASEPENVTLFRLSNAVHLDMFCSFTYEVSILVVLTRHKADLSLIIFNYTYHYLLLLLNQKKKTKICKRYWELCFHYKKNINQHCNLKIPYFTKTSSDCLQNFLEVFFGKWSWIAFQ